MTGTSGESPSVHERLRGIAKVMPTDYLDYGGTVERWSDPGKPYPDCSCGCRHAVWLDADWLVCGKVGGPRQGLLTFEHQAGDGCFEAGPNGEPDIETEGEVAFVPRRAGRRPSSRRTGIESLGSVSETPIDSAE